MAQRIEYDRSACSPREAQIIDALVNTHLTLRGGLLRAGGLSASDPNFGVAVNEFTVAFMASAFPDLQFRLVDV